MILRLILLSTCVWFHLYAADFCGIELAVHLPSGSRLAVAHYEVMDEFGVVVVRGEAAGGIARICDFGFGPHSIRVSRAGFYSTTVNGIRLVYGKTQPVSIVLVPLPDAGNGVPVGTACLVYLRIMSTDQEPLSGVSATGTGTVANSDGFGRMQLIVPLKVFSDYRFEKVGFQATTVALGCASPGDTPEAKVYLIPKRAQ